MQIDLLFLAVAVPGVLIAGVSKGGFGGGASFVAAPILATVMDPGTALGVLLPLLLLMDAAGLRAYWQEWSLLDARRLIVGALPGVALAALIFGLTDPDVFRLLIGCISVGFVAFQAAVLRGWLPLAPTPMGPVAGHLCGAAAGFTSFVAHAGGPAALIYLLSQRLSKLRFQATTVLVFAVVNVIKAALYGGLGIFSAETFAASAVLAPVALVGVLAGVHANRIVPERGFFLLTYVLLLAAGSNLIWTALT